MHLAVVKYPDEVFVTCDIGLRHDVIEEMVNRNNSLITEKEKRGTFTVGWTFRDDSEGAPKTRKITEEQDAETVGTFIAGHVMDAAHSFYTKFEDLKYVYDNANKDDSASGRIQMAPLGRAQRAVACAIILGKPPDELTEVIERKRVYLSESHAVYLKHFNIFLSNLPSPEVGSDE